MEIENRGLGAGNLLLWERSGREFMLVFLGRLVSFAIIFVSINIYALSPSVPIGDDSVFITTTEANELKIMSWNVLNLFDTEKDMFSDDWVWLPQNYPGKQKYCRQIKNSYEATFCKKLDWTPQNLMNKFKQIQKVVNFQGSLPDIFAVVEIENENVIKQMAKVLGYSHWYVTDSGTRRGVDVALLFNERPNFKAIGWHSINTSSDPRHVGRDILRVDFEWQGQLFSVYVNHWVSQGGPNEARMANARALRGDIEEQLRLRGKEFSYVAVGDFNTTVNERPNAFDDVLHQTSWKERAIDLEVIARQDLENESLPYTPPGTQYYQPEDVWNRFDRLVGSQDLIDGLGLEFQKSSYRIPFPKFMSQFKSGANSEEDLVPDGFYPMGPEIERTLRVPYRYDFFTNDENRRGFSDHLPVIFKLKI